MAVRVAAAVTIIIRIAIGIIRIAIGISTAPARVRHTALCTRLGHGTYPLPRRLKYVRVRCDGLDQPGVKIGKDAVQERVLLENRVQMIKRAQPRPAGCQDCGNVIGEGLAVHTGLVPANGATAIQLVSREHAHDRAENDLRTGSRSTGRGLRSAHASIAMTGYEARQLHAAPGSLHILCSGRKISAEKIWMDGLHAAFAHPLDVCPSCDHKGLRAGRH